MSDKYELTDETIELEGHTLHRIRALRDISNNTYRSVRAGDSGGYVETEHNLTQEDDCWIYDTAAAYGNASVSGNAILIGSATVSEDAVVYGNAVIDGRVHGKTRVFGEVMVPKSEFGLFADRDVFDNETLDQALSIQSQHNTDQ